MEFQVRILVDDAFDDESDMGPELARTLRFIADAVERMKEPNPASRGRILDSNRKCVAGYFFTRSRGLTPAPCPRAHTRGHGICRG